MKLWIVDWKSHPLGETTLICMMSLIQYFQYILLTLVFCWPVRILSLRSSKILELMSHTVVLLYFVIGSGIYTVKILYIVLTDSNPGLSEEMSTEWSLHVPVLELKSFLRVINVAGGGATIWQEMALGTWQINGRIILCHSQFESGCIISQTWCQWTRTWSYSLVVNDSYTSQLPINRSTLNWQ